MRERKPRCQEATDRRSGTNGVTTPLRRVGISSLLGSTSIYISVRDKSVYSFELSESDHPIQSTLLSGTRARNLSSHNHDLLALHL